MATRTIRSRSSASRRSDVTSPAVRAEILRSVLVALKALIGLKSLIGRQAFSDHIRSITQGLIVRSQQGPPLENPDAKSLCDFVIMIAAQINFDRLFDSISESRRSPDERFKVQKRVANAHAKVQHALFWANRFLAAVRSNR